MNLPKYILIFVLILIGCNSESKWEVTGDINNDLNRLLKPGLSKFDIMNGIKQSPRQVALNNKFEAGIRKNYEWFQSYLKQLNLEEGKPTPYHENFEMSESEYYELQNYLKNIKLVSTGVMMMNIEKTDSTIKMTPSDQTYLKKIEINFDQNYATFDSLRLDFSDTLRITNN